MTLKESIAIALKEIEENTHHGVIPASLARDIVYGLAHDLLDDYKKTIDDFNARMGTINEPKTTR